MATWLYQLTNVRPGQEPAPKWLKRTFDENIQEGTTHEWGVLGSVVGSPAPAPGDRLLFFYAPTGCRKPGICCVADVITWDRSSKTVTFAVREPTDRLKKHPCWTSEANRLVHTIRGGRARGHTLFLVESMTAEQLTAEIGRCVGGERV